jgi:para-nitrobenzyl esterase
MGLRDMIAAIRWVAAHIASFGGDPAAITLMGQSAGAHSALCMLAMPDVRRLFRRVILHSAPAGIPPFSAARAAGRASRYRDVLGLSDIPQARVVRRLLAVEPPTLLQAASTLARDEARLGQVEPPFFPVVDELADPATFLETAAHGAAADDVQVIIGTNRDEARAIVAGNPDAERAGRAEVDAYLQNTLDADGARRYGQRLAATRPTDVLADAITEVAFVRPSLDFAAQAARAGAAVWAYQLDWAPAGSPLGACHCLELPLIFGTDRAWASAPMLAGTNRDDPGRNRVARQMRAAWLSFTHNERPGPGMRWPTYDGNQRRTMVFGESSGATSDPAGLADSLHAQKGKKP